MPRKKLFLTRKKTDVIVERENRNARGKCRRLIKDVGAVCNALPID